MLPAVSIPHIVILPGFKVYLTESFFSRLTNGSFILHSHPAFELTCINENGEMRFIVTPPLLEHPSVNAAAKTISSMLFSVEKNEADEIGKSFLHLTHQAQIQDTFDGIDRIKNIKEAAYDTQPGASAQIAAECYLLLVNLSRALGNIPHNKELRHETLDEKRISLLEYYFNFQLTNPNCCKKQLADILGVSERHLSRIMEGIYHGSFSDILLQSRMNLADSFFAQGTKSIEQVAEAVGYTSVDSFKRAYKKCFGLSPTQRHIKPLR